jgi:type VI secretion system protein ImpC
MINYRIAQIDEIMSKQLSAILHDPNLQKLEASWQGLHNLVFNTETGTRLKLRLLNVKRDELQKDLENAVEFDQSALFKKVYEEEYGTFGGTPYSLLIGDYEFGRHPSGMSLLEKISNIAAAAHAPFIAAVDPKLFDMESFGELQTPRDLAKIFESAELIKWRSFRDSEDSRYVALALPRTLMRLPYGPVTNPVDGFNFVEEANKDGDFLWGSAAWALGLRITTAFALYSWCAAIRGYEGGGLVSGLPIYTFKADDGGLAVRCPTEIAITDRREKELSDLGFVALCYRKGTDSAAFFGSQTTNKPKVYIEDSATANARLSSQLPYILAASRFAHYIKVIMRDRIGSFMTQDNVSTLLNQWISQYVLLDDSASQELKARYPLREARVDVTDDPAKPGCYKAVVFLRPHFQLDELAVSIRLVATLPPPAA